ncbi:MAG: hypothetical protein ACXW1P_00595 [Methylophilaceae bacterium]
MFIPDPLTTATTFATLVSLISDFRDKHKEVAADDHQKFLEWLSENRHGEMKKLLEQNQATVISIKAILNQDHAVIFEKLQGVDNKLAALLSEDGLFANLVEAIHPKHKLSKQAVSILVQFESSQASEMLEVGMFGAGALYMFVDGLQGQLDYSEARFIKDDLKKLTELSLLRPSSNSSGKQVFLYTRRASDFVKTIVNLNSR